MKNGINTYEEMLKNPMLKIIDFEFLVGHPEAKFLVWEKYNNDYSFKMKIDELIECDASFKKRFYNAFDSFLSNNKLK